MTDRGIGRAVERLARATAVLGGVVLCALVLLTCLSVAGRGLNTLAHSAPLEGGALARWLLARGVGPVLGDFELVEAGIAFAVFCFLPICQLHGAHASVDVFTRALPERARALLVAFWEAVLTAALVLIAWRLGAGLEGKLRNGETTFLLQFPIWWAYAASLAAAVVACLVGLYATFARAREALGGTGAAPEESEGR